MRPCRWAAILMLAWASAGCGGKSSPSVVVSLSPTGATVLLTNTQQFNAGVGGTQNTAVTWQVCNAANPADATGKSGSTITMPTGCVNGSATLGNVNTSGLYTAPATLPSPPTVSIVATSQAVTTVFAVVNVNIDSGIRVSVSPSSATIGTGERFQFTSAVTGTQNQNAAVTWAVDGIAGGSNTPPNVVGTIVPGACTQTQPPQLPNPNIHPNPPGTSVACYTAPSAPPSGGNITISATSVADTTKSGSSTVSVGVATDPILNSTNPLFPASGVEGSAQQDVYLSGSLGTFFSTDLVFVNGTLVPSLFLDVNDIRAVIPATFFANASPSTLSITVQNQAGGTSGPASFKVLPTRPAIASFVPDSLPLGSGGTVNLIGGYFSTSTAATIPGQTLTPSTIIQNSRQLTVTLPGSGFATPGLQPILIQNSDDAAFFSSVNVAVPPAASSIPLAPTATITVGAQPVAVAIDSALGIAVVVNQGTPGGPGSVSLFSLDASSPPPVTTVTVGNMPTSVAVDDQLHLAAVVNSADNTLSIINLVTQALVGPPFPLPSNPTATSPAPSTPIPPPFSIGVNSLTHQALVAYSSTNIATVVDLSANKVVCILGGSNPSMPKNCSTIPLSNTRPVSTGTAPQIAVDPQLNWAVVTPGGAGAISLVDLGAPATASQVARIPDVIATLTLTTTTRGVSIDSERNRALFADPRQASLTLFSDLDQTVSNIRLDINEIASAVNPLTDVGVVVNNLTNTATVVDLQTLQKITSVTVGSSPMAVAVDPGKNVAVIANQGDNTVSILQLGPMLSPQITEISSPTTFTVPPSSSGSFTLTVNGFGFASGASPASVRLDGTSVPTTVSSNGRQATATIPNSMLNAPRRFALDVMNPGSTTSNEENFTVIGAVPVGLNPMSVAIDSNLDEVLVTVQGTIDPSTGACSAPGTVSLVNMATAAVINSLPVGTCPEGVAMAPRLGRAVVANNGSNDATVLDYFNKVVLSTVNLGLDASPMGVAIQPDTSTAAIANFGNNTVSVFSISGSSVGSPSTILVDQGPVGLSVDPDDNLLAVTAATQNAVDIVNLGARFLAGRLPNFQNPTDASFDPITGNFLVANSLANNIGVVDPVTSGASPIQAGINPTAIAYNFQSSTAVTVNRATNTMSVLDFLATNKNGVLTFSGRQVREILPMGGSNEFSVAINPITNVAAVVDQANGRLLLVPLPR